MGSQYTARLGVILGIDTAKWEADIDSAIAANKKLKREITKDTNAAEKEIERLTWAIKDYGRQVTESEKLERSFLTGGKFEKATDLRKAKLRELAKSYDDVVAAAKKADQAKLEGMLGKGGNKFNQQQMAALGYQTTDIITGLASGQNPLLVLIQQGGQLRDQFGGVKNVFSAFASVLSPLKLTIGGITAVIGTLAYAFYQGSKEAQAFKDNLILTNQYSGLTTKSLNELSTTLSSKLNVTIGNAKEAFYELSASGKFTKTSIGAVGEAVLNFSKLAGVDGSQAAKELMSSFDGTASAAKSLNDKYHYLNLSQYKQIELLEQQGKKQEAIKVQAEAFNESIRSQARDVGYLALAWEDATKWFSSYWNELKKLGDIGTNDDLIKRTKNQIETIKASIAATNDGKGNKAQQDALAIALINLKYYESQKEKAEQDALERQKKNQQVTDYERAGGLKRITDLEFEASKQAIEKEAQLRMQGANEFKRIDVEAWKEKELAKLELSKRFREVGYGLESEERKAVAAKLSEIDEKAQQKKLEISRLRQREIDQRQTADENAVQKEKEKLELYRENIFLSDTDYKIALDRLRTEQEIAKIMKDERLSPEAKEALANRERQIQTQREGVEKLGESLKMLRDINQAVFQNMTDALTNFIMTGKLNFRNFAATLIMEIVRIQAASVAAQASRGLMNFIGPILQGMFAAPSAVSLGSQPLGGGTSTGFGVNPNAGGFGLRAGGGDILGGQPVIVGDAGPELFIPRNAGTIVPSSQLANSMGNNVVTNYYIDAIDTKSFEDRLLGSHNAVWAANQYANKSLPLSRGRA